MSLLGGTSKRSDFPPAASTTTPDSVPRKAGQLRGLLADGVVTKQQADDEIHEDRLLNFLINTLTSAFSLNLGENAEIDPDDIFEVLVGAEWSALPC
jgi:hypothetical protein